MTNYISSYTGSEVDAAIAIAVTVTPGANYVSTFSSAVVNAAILKVQNIEDNATADQTADEIESLYEGLSDTNKYTDAEKTKLSTVESGANVENPMTTPWDLIRGASSGFPTRLGIGSDAQVLTVSSGQIIWANPVSGFTNPMNNPGEMIIGSGGGTAIALGVGAEGQVLTFVSGAPVWQNAESGFSNPMNAVGDIIVSTDGSGTAAALPIGTASQVLAVNSGANGLEWVDSSSTADLQETIIVALSSETNPIEEGTAVASFRMPFDMTLTSFKITIRSPGTNIGGTGVAVAVDCQNNPIGAGATASILSAWATMDSGVSFGTQTIDFPNLLENDLIFFNIEQIGSNVAGTGLKAVLIGTRVI